MKSTKKHTTESFVEICNQIRGNKYDYSMVSYMNSKTKVKILCREHGIFEQTPNNHISKLQDCPKCSPFYFEKKDTNKLIDDFRKIHHDSYDYSMISYTNNKSKVKIICSEHGIFEQTPNNHLKRQKCPSCSKMTTISFIEKSQKIHNYKYDYSKTLYIGNMRKVDITCIKHGIFSQRAGSHLYGNGCPTCLESKGEREIHKILTENNIDFISQYSFEDCKFKNKLKFDFYLIKLNTCIEFDGKQHIEYYGGLDSFKKRMKRDSIKNNYCQTKNIKLIRIKYDDDIKSKLLSCL